MPQELAKAIDAMAVYSGDLPFWTELVARDLPEAAQSVVTFSLVEFSGKLPDGIPWFSLSDRPLEIPFDVHPDRRLRIVIGPMKAHCMCHSVYAIRILDADGKVIWKDTTTAFGAVSVGLAASEGGGGHVLFLDRYDHGKPARFVLEAKFQPDEGNAKDDGR
jgi:hypothetical protein